MTDETKIASSDDGRNRPRTFEQKRQEALGWFGPNRLAERRRRREGGEPLLQLVDEGQEEAA